MKALGSSIGAKAQRVARCVAALYQEQRGRCYSCGLTMIVGIRTQKGRNLDKRMLTLEHVVPRSAVAALTKKTSS